jgi:hypothetical protein
MHETRCAERQMAKLKYDLALARQDGLIYGIPENGDEKGTKFLLHGVGALDAKPGRESLSFYHVLEKGTPVTLKLTVDDGTPPGFRRVVIRVGATEIFTGDWALER